MKYALVLLFFCICSCRKSDTVILEGTWKMVSMSGTIAGIHQTYPKGDIIWTFGTQLKVSNIYPGNNNYSLPSDTYSYSIFENKLGKELYVNTHYYSDITKLTADTLVLDDNLKLSDGIRYTFIK